MSTSLQNHPVSRQFAHLSWEACRTADGLMDFVATIAATASAVLADVAEARMELVLQDIATRKGGEDQDPSALREAMLNYFRLEASYARKEIAARERRQRECN